MAAAVPAGAAAVRVGTNRWVLAVEAATGSGVAEPCPMEGVMKINVGTADKVLRVVVGLVVIGIGFAAKSWWGAIGLVPLLTAFVGFCPLYALLGVSTCKVKSGASGLA